MPLEAPNLDNRRFNDLVAEARSRIPRYAPEWTDHNLSDPGITLIQLFSWLGEIILFRLNQVPERNYIKFLQLIGVERTPAFPASAELTFTLASPDTVSVVVAKGTQVSAKLKQPPSAVGAPPLPEDDKPIVFETEEPMNAIGATLERVQVFDGINFLDYTEENKPTGKSYPAFGSRARENSAVMFGFASNNAFPTVEINLLVRMYFDPSLLRPLSSGLSEKQIHPPATVVWEYWTGSEWRKLDVLKDETRALTASGHVYFRGPANIKKDKLGVFTQPTDIELYWIRAHLTESHYEMPPELDAVLTNTVRATAVTTVKDEVIGASDGQPSQIFQLRNAPVFAKTVRPVDERLARRTASGQPPTEAEQEALDRSLREQELTKGFWLEVDEGQGFKPWEEVEDFFNSDADDRHYTLQRSTGEVRFGNGERGAIPVAGINNIVVRYYRYGGGSRGNVGAETATDLQTAVVGVDKVTNFYPAEGGADEESIEDTKTRAPKEIKARDRAVTNEDFEFISRQTPGVRVRRAHALPLHHPEFPGIEVPGVVTVIVVPESKDPKPMPSEGTLQTVCEYLNQRRLLTTEVFVSPPSYKQVKIEATILAKPTADPAVVKTEIEQALTTYLHPLEGGADGQGWPLGEDVLYSEIFRVVLQIDGVQTIEDLRIVVDGERFDRCDNGTIPDDFLVFSDGHDITVTFTARAA
jgi:predicted phage baseplate assembly protein